MNSADSRSDRRLHDHPILGPMPPTETVEFSFDGQTLVARAGEPIAVALLAHGVRVFRTMPRSGEARGPYCMVGRCADCLMTVDGNPSVRACVTPVQPGMRVVTQHGLGSWEPGEGQA